MSYAEDENYDGYDLEVDAENECNHDLYEQETACADGFCPICATAKIVRLTKLQDELAEAVAKERERCARVSEEYPGALHSRQEELMAYDIAAAIRKGE